MTSEWVVALGVLGAVTVAAIAADRRRRRPGREASAEAEPVDEEAALPADEQAIGRIDYESPAEENPQG